MLYSSKGLYSAKFISLLMLFYLIISVLIGNPFLNIHHTAQNLTANACHNPP